MFIAIVDSRSGRQEASVDVAQDYDEYDIDVFIETEEFCNSARIYGDEGFYALGCASLSLDSHTDVERVFRADTLWRLEMRPQCPLRRAAHRLRLRLEINRYQLGNGKALSDG